MNSKRRRIIKYCLITLYRFRSEKNKKRSVLTVNRFTATSIPILISDRVQRLFYFAKSHRFYDRANLSLSYSDRPSKKVRRVYLPIYGDNKEKKCSRRGISFFCSVPFFFFSSHRFLHFSYVISCFVGDYFCRTHFFSRNNILKLSGL